MFKFDVLLEQLRESDVYNSKWKNYRALLTQSGENPPIARVLNQDESDYLGDATWEYSDVGKFNISGIDCDEYMTEVYVGDRSYLTEGFKAFETMDYTSNGFTLVCMNSLGSFGNGILLNTPFEIKVRQRGIAPVLLMAETTVNGYEIILTFDKKMTDYNYAIASIAFIVTGSTTMTNSTAWVIIDNVISLSMNAPCTFGEELLISVNENIESFDYGLVGTLTYFPVTNSVMNL